MNNINLIRKKKKITLNDISKTTNLSVGYLCHLSNGSRDNPSFNVMKKIATALGEDVFTVFGNKR